MQILQLTKSNYQSIATKAAKALKAGSLLIYPTETCYGLGVDPTNEEAVKKLFQFKGRREGKPVSIAVSSKEMASKYVEINELAENLYDNFLPGPVTVVSNSRGKVVKGIDSEFGTLGIRIPDYPLVLDIIELAQRPMTATSANVSYKPRPYSIESWLKNTPQKSLNLVDLVIDAGTLPHRESSTVVDTTLNNPQILREGDIKFDKYVKNKNTVVANVSKSTEDTIKLGGLSMLKALDSLNNNQPVVFLLKGELGAGKTHFTKGIAKQLGIGTLIKSPTYTIIAEYPHKKGVLYHIDTWRVFNEAEFARLKIEDFLKPGNVIAIEWPEKFIDILDKMLARHNTKVFNVVFEVMSPSQRKITVYEK